MKHSYTWCDWFLFSEIVVNEGTGGQIGEGEGFQPLRRFINRYSELSTVKKFYQPDFHFIDLTFKISTVLQKFD
ncbi:hypothetical protein [Rossellomorea sp. FM04394]|uniref:hypothetical protein n=1 Tax=Rossellomorea sp. FM04394 TaxID=3243076 RepID=UPI0035A5AEF7